MVKDSIAQVWYWVWSQAASNIGQQAWYLPYHVQQQVYGQVANQVRRQVSYKIFDQVKEDLKWQQ